MENIYQNADALQKGLILRSGVQLAQLRIELYNVSWLHLKLISVHIAVRLRTTCALLFWRMWPAAADWTLLIDERSFSVSFHAVLSLSNGPAKLQCCIKPKTVLLP